MGKYRFPTWWGGVVDSDEPPMIATQLQQLRAEVGFLKAEVKSGGPRFAIKSAKDLMEKLRPALDKLEMVCFTATHTGGNIPLTPVVDGDGDVVAGEGTLAFLMATTRIGCKDGSYVDVVGSGHGADQQDKAGGKCSTYAWKDSLIKGLSLPDDDMVDTDDEEKPLKKGLRQKSTKAAPAKSKQADKPKTTVEDVRAAIAVATNLDELKAAGASAKELTGEEQTSLMEEYKAKKAELSK